MIAELISKLAKRKAETSQAAVSEWQKLVTEFVDSGGKVDPDAVLSKLDRLGRTLEDLEQAAELLTKRRGWATQLDAGSKAESEYPKLTKQIEDANAELVRLTEAHDAKHAHLDDKIRAARNAISMGADAKRQLLDTAGEETRLAATMDVDQKILDLQSERDALRKRIRDREGWLGSVRELGDNAAPQDRQRWNGAVAEFDEWQDQDRAFETRFEALQRERTKASEVLLRPESI